MITLAKKPTESEHDQHVDDSGAEVWKANYVLRGIQNEYSSRSISQHSVDSMNKHIQSNIVV